MTINVLYFGSSKGIGLTEHLTQYAIGLKNQGINVTIVYDGKEQRKGLVNELREYSIKSLLISNIENWKFLVNSHKLSKVIDEEAIDLIQCQGIHHLVLSYIGKTLSKQNPIIVTYIHAYPSKNLVIRFSNFILNNLSDLIFAVSSQTKNLLSKKGLNPKKTIVIYNALNFDEINRYLNECHSNEYEDIVSKISNNKSVIWGSTNLSVKKGHVTLLFAAKKVIEQVPNVKFVLTGSGEFKQELLKIAAELNIKNNVLFVGRIKRSTLIQLMKYSSLSVVPSRSETFCHALIEPMAVGTPVISTPVGIAEDVIEDGKTGYLVPIDDTNVLADRIIYLLNNDSLANQMGHTGMKLVEKKFDVNLISKKILIIYEELLYQKCKALDHIL